MELHELTDNVCTYLNYNDKTWTSSEVDSRIREWLGKKEKELNERCQKAYYANELCTWRDVHEVLGLSLTVKEEVKEHDCPEHPNQGCGWGKPKEMKKEWCEHIEVISSKNRWYRIKTNWFSILDTWMFCPVCSTPRPPEPQKKSLADKFEETFQTGKPWTWEQIAAVATAHFESGEKEKPHA